METRDQIIKTLRLWFNTTLGITQYEHCADEILKLLPVEPKIPTDTDIEHVAADYINEPEQTWNTADYLHIADAYEQGARDMRDNNIYISPK